MGNFFNIMISQPLNTVIINWAKRVQRNGGATPSLQTLTAMDRFYNGLCANNLSASIITLNVFAPDSLIACQTPLFTSFGGKDPWLNTNFTAAHLSVDGLQGATGRFFNSGVSCSLAWVGAQSSSMGMTLYVTSASNGNENDMGTWNATAPYFSLYAGYSGTAYFDCNTSVAGGRCYASNNSWTGYIAGNRISRTDSRIDKASSTVRYQTIATATTLATGANTAPAVPIGVFRMMGSTTLCTKRLSFAAAHRGFDSGSAVTFYNLIQQLRKGLGGGWV